jgi:endonuclease-8
MPEGDSIFRAARTLDRALAGRTVTRFESVFPRLTRVDQDNRIRGRTLERVTPRGKHLLMWFSGALVLHTHMRMKGSWHLYRPGERWMRPHHDMRIVVGTDEWDAVAFNVPVAEFLDAGAAEQGTALSDLGPDLLSPAFATTASEGRYGAAGLAFDLDEAVRRLEALPHVEIGDALLNQQALAGIGNIYKSEALFACGVSPFVRVGDLPRDRLAKIVSAARRLLQASASAEVGSQSDPTSGAGWAIRFRGSPPARPGPRSVYGRGGKPCRRCGATIRRRAQGPNARSTYWCPRCQRAGPSA